MPEALLAPEVLTPATQPEPPPLALDPAWQAVADLLAIHIRPGERVLAPLQFWPALPAGVLVEAEPGEADTAYHWVVCHKGEIAPHNLLFWEALPDRAYPVFANDVFVVWFRRPRRAGLPALRRTPHLRAYHRRVRRLVQAQDMPIPGLPGRLRRLVWRLGRTLCRVQPLPQAALPASAAAPPRPSSTEYSMPLFLLRPPADPALPWRFAPPSLARPVSQLCTAEQFSEPAFARLSAMLGIPPSPRRHRKIWEFCYILAAIEAAGMLRPGLRALGFGTGVEPLPSALAAQGLSVLATDAPPELMASQGWASTQQHSHDVMQLHRPKLLPADLFRQRVTHRAVDMNAIPPDLAGFDVTWSACSLEHLGSLRHGLDFIEASLGCLRPGGIAVHTTEFNLLSNGVTLQTPECSLFRKVDIEEFLARMVAAGHEVWPLNLWPGGHELDEVIDLPPYLPNPQGAHLKLDLQRYVTTSIGLVIRRRG
ncbi:hypothetical protein NON00_13915 [Roseomonas sp. GC11]|uniref:hypothetical protein n=1 Tax=Roseomonas sp. GC11 TaxID=2950546 RepID=UPI002108675B|nr:hypothetical protein [Roseomonas sp. GC11]MCQ4161017.1 hypothetical protein [Roseomonas sp. GC11]